MNFNSLEIHVAILELVPLGDANDGLCRPPHTVILFLFLSVSCVN